MSIWASFFDITAAKETSLDLALICGDREELRIGIFQPREPTPRHKSEDKYNHATIVLSLDEARRLSDALLEHLKAEAK